MKNTLSDNGFVWWIGVVENRADPAKLGRCQVRIFGYHTENTEDLPIEGLPWAMVMMPATSASISGVGSSPTGLIEGSWVLGFFLDGNRAQEPVVMGSLPGYNDGFSSQGGFSDPNGVYPRETGPATNSRSRGIDPYDTQDLSNNVNLGAGLVDIVASFEGFSPKAFWDHKQYSIGYGTKANSASEVITKEEAKARLESNLSSFASQVERWNGTWKYNWSGKQKDALTSFAYNLGSGTLRTLTDNGKRSNREISEALLLYNKASGQIVNGLVNRRISEQRLFLDGTSEDKIDFRPGVTV
jgi:GH24 family phage-related lysozyme (muramidase)